MSKKHFHQPKPPEPEQLKTVLSSPQPGDRCPCCDQLVHDPNAIPKQRQCPLCWGTAKGVGQEKWHRRVSGTLMKQCFVCNQCGHDWTADVRTVVEPLRVEYQEVRIETRG
jgi:hypothetical protein